MVATGRVPNTKTLGLENMGIETFRGFVQVRIPPAVLCVSSIYIWRLINPTPFLHTQSTDE